MRWRSTDGGAPWREKHEQHEGGPQQAGGQEQRILVREVLPVRLII